MDGSDSGGVGRREGWSMKNENGRRLLAVLLDEHIAVVGETWTAKEALAFLAAPDADDVRDGIAARLDRAAVNNTQGAKRVLTMLARVIREGRENE